MASCRVLEEDGGEKQTTTEKRESIFLSGQ